MNDKCRLTFFCVKRIVITRSQQRTISRFSKYRDITNITVNMEFLCKCQYRIINRRYTPQQYLSRYWRTQEKSRLAKSLHMILFFPNTKSILDKSQHIEYVDNLGISWEKNFLPFFPSFFSTFFSIDQTEAHKTLYVCLIISEQLQVLTDLRR